MRGKISYSSSGKPSYQLDGKQVSQAEFDAAFPSKMEELLACGNMLPSHQPGCWPMPGSEALAVHPEQVAEATEDARKKVVPTEFDRQGRPILRDRGHRRDYLRAYSMRDRDGGYGDG